jgi:quercetin dioxygenase-like cupin family protein
MKLSLCGALVVPVLLLSPQTDKNAPVPVEEEPLHKVVFQNEAVTIMHLILPPGKRTLYHIHTHDRVAIDLSSTVTTNQEWNHAEGSPSPTKPGEVGALTLTGASYTHRVHNVGKVPYDVLDIEPAARPDAPSPDVAAPVAAETPSARVYKWDLAPGATSPMHTHMRPYIIVSVTGMNLKMTAPDGQTGAHEVSAGDFKYVDAHVTHNLSNIGTTQGQIIEVELK